jgi:hypothetical protein
MSTSLLPQILPGGTRGSIRLSASVNFSANVFAFHSFSLFDSPLLGPQCLTAMKAVKINSSVH